MHRKHWIIAPLTAVMLLLGLTLGAGPAAATTGNGTGQACKYDYFTYNACLNIFEECTLVCGAPADEQLSGNGIAGCPVDR